MGYGEKPNPNQLSDQPDVLCPERQRERFSPGGFVLPAIVDNGHVLSATDPDPAEWGGNCCNISMVL